MTSINKVLLTFFLLVALSFIGAWKFVQSEQVGTFLSTEISKFTSKKFGLKVSFSNIKLNIVPVGTIFENVLINMKDESFSVNAREVHITFGFLDLLSNELSIENLLVDSGVIQRGRIKKENFNGVKLKIKISELFDIIKSNTIENKNVRLKSISLNNINFVDEQIGSAKLTSFTAAVYNNVVLLDGVVDASGALNSFFENENVEFLKHDEITFNAELISKKLRIKQLLLKDGLNKLKVEGVFTEVPSGEVVSVANVVYQGDIAKFASIIDDNIQGYARITSSISGNVKSPKIGTVLEVIELKSPWALVDYGSIFVEYEKGIVSVDKLQVKKDDGEVSLSEPTNIYDFEQKKLLFKSVNLKLNKIHTNSALYFLNDILKIFKGKISGDVTFSYENQKLIFDISEGSTLTEFVLGDNENKYILKNKKIDLFKSRVLVELSGATYLDIDLGFEGSRVQSRGWIKNGRLDLFSNVGIIDLEGLGPISGAKLKGNGAVKFDFVGPFENVKLLIFTELKDFEVLRYKIGQVKAEVEILLNKAVMKLNKVSARRDTFDYSANGSIDFIDSKLDISFDMPKMSYSTLHEICYPLVSEFWSPDPKLNDFNLRSKFRIFGRATLTGIKIEGSASSQGLFIYGEGADQLKSDFNYKNGEISFNNILINKNEGKLYGDISFNGISKYLKYKINYDKGELASFKWYQLLGLGLDSGFNMKLSGEGFLHNLKSETSLNLINSNVDSIKIGDSNFFMKTEGQELDLTAEAFDRQISLKSFLNFNKNSKSLSTVVAKIDIDNIKNIFAALEKKNMEDPYLKGVISGSVNSSFRLDSFEKGNLDLIIDYLNFERKSSSIRTHTGNNKIIVKNGKIENWKISLKGNDDYIYSSGEGNIFSKFRLENEYRVSANILELLSSKYVLSEGTIFGRYLILGDKLNFDSYLEASGEKIKIRFDKLPGIFTNSKFHLIADGPLVNISLFESTYGNGKILGNGKLKLGFDYPEIDVKASIDKTLINVFKKSSFLVNGRVRLHGDSLPYKMSGNINLVHGKIFEEIEDLAQNKVGNRAIYKYVPEKKIEQNFNLIDYDFLISMLGPVHIQNQLSDLKMYGNLKVTGTTFSPRVSGLLESRINGESKFKFKGHDFNISEGEVTLGTAANENDVFLKFSGNADVKNYNVKLDLQGPAEKLSMSLSSNPPLSKEDLFSLLTLGVTADLSKDLGEEQRQSVTTIGIGSLIFDQLKLNEGLSSSMGLKLSIIPEISKDDTSFLEGKSAVANTSTKVKSTTKIKIEKRITDDVDISLTSTVGGTIEQKQEMNINYNFNENISLDGVFEVKDEDDEDSKSSQSVGADIKYKWSF